MNELINEIEAQVVDDSTHREQRVEINDPVVTEKVTLQQGRVPQLPAHVYVSSVLCVWSLVDFGSVAMTLPLTHSEGRVPGVVTYMYHVYFVFM